MRHWFNLVTHLVSNKLKSEIYLFIIMSIRTILIYICIFVINKSISILLALYVLLNYAKSLF